jgi:type I restriction enzyme M protein
MVAIRSNFFYTRTVPCELRFLDRSKPKAHHDKVLMIDARNTYRKVTRKIYDFSPEQLLNLLAIVWLYRGQPERFLDLVFGYLQRMLDELGFCFQPRNSEAQEPSPLWGNTTTLNNLFACIDPFTDSLDDTAAHADIRRQVFENMVSLNDGVAGFQAAVEDVEDSWQRQKKTAVALNQAVRRLAPLAEKSRRAGRADLLELQGAGDIIEDCRLSFKKPQPQVGEISCPLPKKSPSCLRMGPNGGEVHFRNQNVSMISTRSENMSIKSVNVDM